MLPNQGQVYDACESRCISNHSLYRRSKSSFTCLTNQARKVAGDVISKLLCLWHHTRIWSRAIVMCTTHVSFRVSHVVSVGDLQAIHLLRLYFQKMGSANGKVRKRTRRGLANLSKEIEPEKKTPLFEHRLPKVIATVVTTLGLGFQSKRRLSRDASSSGGRKVLTRRSRCKAVGGRCGQVRTKRLLSRSEPNRQ